MMALDTAQGLAAAHPGARLPCPICAASLKSSNLASHLRKVHPGASVAPSPWRGIDRRVLRTTLIALTITMVAALGLLTTVLVPGSPVAMGLVAVLVVLMGLVFGALLRSFSATLVLDGDTFVLHHSFGLGRRRAQLPCAITVGALEGFRPGNASLTHEYDPKAPPVIAGWYLQLGNLTLGCHQDTAFRTHWNPSTWRAGPRRMTYDVRLPREAMIALEYTLVARGYLLLVDAPAQDSPSSSD